MRDGLCGELREDLSAYVDDELGADARARLEGHLRACEECRGELERLRKLVRLVSSVPREEPPAGLREKISARVREERRPRRFVLRMPWWVTSSAAAAALVGVVALAGVLRTPLERAPARREAPAAARPGEAAEEAAPMAAPDADRTLAFEAKRKALPPAPPARAPEPALRKARARRVEEPSPTSAEKRPAAAIPLPEKKREAAARGARRLEHAGEGLKEEEARAMSGPTRAPARPEPLRPALGPRVTPPPDELQRADARPADAERARAAPGEKLAAGTAPPPASARRAREGKAAERVSEVERPEAKADESAARKAAARAPALAMKEAEERDEGLEVGRLLELIAGSFEEARKLVRLAARDAGGKLERTDSAAGELVCLIPEGRVNGFAAALSPSGDETRSVVEQKKAPEPAARGRRRRVSAAEYEKGAEEAAKPRFIRVLVRVKVRRP